MYFQIPKARLLLSCGASIFMYDYQGFGKSQGKPTVEGACDDAVAAYDYLVNTENRTGKDIIAMGQSFGSGVNQAIELFNRAIEPKQILILPQGHCSFGRGNEFAKVVREFLRRHDL